MLWVHRYTHIRAIDLNIILPQGPMERLLLIYYLIVELQFTWGNNRVRVTPRIQPFLLALHFGITFMNIIVMTNISVNPLGTPQRFQTHFDNP